MTARDAAFASADSRLRPAVAMLVLSICGMATGLAIDCGTTPPELLAALCADSAGGLAATLSFHVAVMPASYAMMAATAVLAVSFNAANGARRPSHRPGSHVAAAAASVAAMLLGMFAGGWLAPDAARLFGTEPGFGALVIGMVAGMAAAAVGFAAIAHAATAVSERKLAQYIMYQ